jgi:hypothetical protein
MIVSEVTDGSLERFTGASGTTSIIAPDPIADCKESP